MQRGVRSEALRGSSALVAATTATMVVSAVATALAVRLSGGAIDRFLDDPGASAGMGLAVAALVVGAIGSVLWSVSDIGTARIATRVGVRVRSRMVRHALSLPIGFFADRSAGEITDRISTDVDTVVVAVVNQAKPIAMGTLGAVVAIAMSATVDWRLALLFLPATGLVVWTGTRAGRRVAEGSRDLFAEWSTAAGTAEEAFGARDDLRQALGRGYVMRLWAQHGADIWSHRNRMSRDQNLLVLSTAGFLRAFQWVILCLGSIAAIDGRLGAGDVWAAFGLVRLFSTRVEEVLSNVPRLSEAVAATQRIDELLAEEPETSTDADRPDVPTTTVDWDRPVSVGFSAVDFAYADGPPVLDDVTFEVRPGRSLALVGRTGSGKSTLVRLLNRTVEPPRGSVLVGGVDVCDIDRRELRGRIGTVSQRVEILRAPLRDNITLFDPAITDERIIDALTQLGLAAWLAALPAGLDTRLGERGTTLSSGEEQLVAFARLLVRNPSVIVLDEATARLDPGTERLLQLATERLLAGRTSIIVAHRLATISGADQVVVLERGRVVEHGSREELVRREGSAFGRLVEAAGGLEVREVVERHAADARPVSTVVDRTPALGGGAPRPAAPTVWRTTARLLGSHRRWFVPGVLGWLVFFVAPAFTTWVWAGLLPELRPGGDVGGLLAVFAVASAAGIVGRMVGDRFYMRWWVLSNLTMRSNLLAAQLHPHDRRVGARPASPGDAVSRVWDTNLLTEYADHVVDLVGTTAFLLTVTALSGSWSTLPWLAVVVVVPFALVLVLHPRIDAIATEHAQVRGEWSGRVAEVCAAATTVKGFAAEPHVVEHLDELTRRRQRLAYRERRLELAAFAPVFLTAEVSQRLVVILAIASGSTARAADAVAIAEAVSVMPMAGIVVCMLVMEAPLVRARLRRIARLLPGTGDFDLTAPPADLVLPPDGPRPVPTARPRRTPLHALHVDHLRVVHDDGTVALDDISFEVRRGQLVVVTGPVASGKSTLLRALAGLCPPTGGDIRWDGTPVADPSEFLRPPNCSFVHQTPTIVSGTIADNIALDHDVDVDASIELAQLVRDLEVLGGSGALVGHRGLRLSGGQTQRLATARATASQSELLVLDDLSSALDVETEHDLWVTLREQGHTVVATSYKRTALELADLVVVLRGGRIDAAGSLPELEATHGHLFA